MTDPKKLTPEELEREHFYLSCRPESEKDAIRAELLRLLREGKAMKDILNNLAENSNAMAAFVLASASEAEKPL